MNEEKNARVNMKGEKKDKRRRNKKGEEQNNRKKNIIRI